MDKFRACVFIQADRQEKARLCLSPSFVERQPAPPGRRGNPSPWCPWGLGPTVASLKPLVPGAPLQCGTGPPM